MIVTGYFGSSNISLELGWLDIIIYSIWTEKNDGICSLLCQTWFIWGFISYGIIMMANINT